MDAKLVHHKRVNRGDPTNERYRMAEAIGKALYDVR